MWNKNEGKNGDEILQNQFTAYLTLAVQRKRKDYIKRLSKYREFEFTTWDAHTVSATNMEQENVLVRILYNEVMKVVHSLSERDRYIFLAHTIEGESFQSLSQKLGLSYKGTTSIFYRVRNKIRIQMEERR